MNARFALLCSFAAASIVACGSAFSAGDSGSASGSSTGGAGPSTTATATATPTASSGGSSSAGTSDVASSGTGGADCFSSNGMGCDDPACQDVVLCEPAAPITGWSGPLLIAIADDKSQLPSCPDYLPEKSDHVELVTPTPDRGCSCHCDDGSGSCKVEISFANASDCLEGMLAVVDGSCTPITAQNGSESYVNRLLTTQTTMGTCPVSVHAASAPELVQDHVRLCDGDTVKGCVGSTCLPVDTKEFAVCIVATGDMMCPMPYKTKKHIYDEAVADNRACSLGTCSCGAASPPSGCGGTVTVFDDASCVGTAIGTVTDMCTQQNEIPRSVSYVVPNQTCASMGAPAVTGQVDTSGEKTVCCLP